MIKLFLFCINLVVTNQDTFPNQLPLLHPIRQTDFKYISSKYGWRIDPITQDSSFHEGIDIATISMNAAVYATADGIVETLDYDKKRGLFIIINHAFGFWLEIRERVQHPICTMRYILKALPLTH